MAQRMPNDNNNSTCTTLITKEEKSSPSDDSYCNPVNVIHFVTNGIRSVASTTRIIFTEFEGAMKIILPKLSPDERDQVYKLFGEYQSMLMTTQEFIARTTLRIQHARTQEHLVYAIDLDVITRLCDISSTLLPKFWGLNALISEKVKDERAIKMFRNISLGLAGLAASVLLIGTGVGAAAGFTAVVKGVLLISGATTVVGLTAGAIAQAAQKLSAFEQVIKNLKNIKQILSQLSQRYSMIRGMHGELRMEDQLQFIDLLKEAKLEVDKGFAILTKL